MDSLETLHQTYLRLKEVSREIHIIDRGSGYAPEKMQELLLEYKTLIEIWKSI